MHQTPSVRTSHLLTHLILFITLSGRDCHHSYFTEEDTSTEKLGTCLVSQLVKARGDIQTQQFLLPLPPPRHSASKKILSPNK